MAKTPDDETASGFGAAGWALVCELLTRLQGTGVLTEEAAQEVMDSALTLLEGMESRGSSPEGRAGRGLLERSMKSWKPRPPPPEI